MYFMNEKNIIFMKEDVMKKLLVLALVLSMASLASAGLQLSVNGNTAQTAPIILLPSDELVLDIHGDGADSNPTPYILVIGPGAINGGTIVYDPGSSLAAYWDAEAKAAENGFATVAEYLADFGANQGVVGLTDLAVAEIVSDKGVPPATIGLLADLIIFHCEGPGEVLIRLVGWDDTGAMFDYDTLTITQVPEPMTMALLGLGGLFLRRRK